ncbi:HTH-type transcriptional activator RhaR [Paenibacillus allorhizoplanae]|uniref:HTH-type transcriptional activator RhaR n=1 Tax=Paenibacillus allorhizoplanae TaxID=2905648 RepID=A0ABM9C4Q9_9BACL|nr:helix-turn-helix domain-containing protein [Paenibacillus allorhizoplanae]CAH1202278.1 HTH-type transcriptional activator RhaR [Paenibacillus allorhizoplanae]
MSRNWFHRLLISYLPVLILIGCLFVFIGIIQLSELSQRNAVKSSQIYAQNLQNNIDTSLRSIEIMMIEMISRNTKPTSFASMESSPEFIVDLSQLLQGMVSTNSLIDSIYIYRAGDGTIVTDQTKLTLEQSADGSFVEANLSALSKGWSDPRTFRTFKIGNEKKTVISIAKGIPLTGKGTALLVVNVKVDSIQQYLDKFGQSDVSYISVSDRAGVEMFRQGGRSSHEDDIVVTSNYTGWTYKSGLKEEIMGNVFSYITSGWVMLGFLGLLIGIWWIIYISRKNYKPIETMMSRIQKYNQQHKNSFIQEASVDDLSYIDYTLSNMIEASEDYENRNQENNRFRRLRLFQQLVEGVESINQEEWNVSLRELEIDVFTCASVSIIEIDKYSEFISQYSHADQGLFKYILTKVVDETAKADSLRIWQEWVTNHRLCVIYFGNDEELQHQLGSRILTQSEQIREWLQNNLKLTVTLGIGEAVTEASAVSVSYDTALKVLSYKSALGSNRVIGHWEIDVLSHDDMFVYLQYVRTIAQAFRVGSEKWQEELKLLFDGLRSLLLPKEEIDSVLIYMNFFFHREMTELPPVYQTLWNNEFRIQWIERMESLETLDEVESFYLERLTSCDRKMKSLREEKGNHAIVRRVREYIEEHFDNPDLSLSMLSEKFNMNASSLSLLFKSEFGEKFVVYLCQVRMEHAKELLRDGNLPIHEISVMVGYLQPISFIRTFKKTVGVTPGDYRKVHQ